MLLLLLSACQPRVINDTVELGRILGIIFKGLRTALVCASGILFLFPFLVGQFMIVKKHG